MNKTIRKTALLLAVLTMTVSLSGCGKKPVEELKTSVITLDGTDITLGQTTLKEMKDAGFSIAVNEMLTTPLDESMEMPGRTYDVGIYLYKNDMRYASVQCVNDLEDPIPYIDSIINLVTIYYADARDPYIPPYYTENMKINGLDLKGLTPDEVLTQFGDEAESPGEIKYPDGAIASLSFKLGDCHLSLSFDNDTGTITEAEIEMYHSKF